MIKRIFPAFLAILFALSASPALAMAHIETGDYIDLPALSDDAYVAGQNVTASGEITGDLFAAGAIVRCSSNVSQDVNLAGSVVDLFCNVGDDARLAGSIITIGGTVEDDVIAVGAMVRVLPGAVIKGDLITGAGSVVIDGKVEGSVLGGGGQMVVQGNILGSVVVQADDLQIGRNANIAGALQYTSNKEAKIDELAVIGAGIEHKIPEKPVINKQKDRGGEVSFGALFGLWFVFFLLKVIIASVTILVALYFGKKHILAMTDAMLTKFPAQLGWGFVWTITIPIASLILIFTIFGSMLGIFGLIIFALAMFIAKLLAMVGLGSWLWKVFTKASTYKIDWKIVLVGVIVMSLIASIPILGWIFAAIFTLAAMGSVLQYLKNIVK